MAAPETLHVRNIVLVGQDGAGKTSLAEAMLYISGQTPRMGTTHDGKTYLDYDASAISNTDNNKINLLDTSGHPDFIGDTLATMHAAEMAMFVVDAVEGPQVMTTKLWREAEDMRLSRAVYINHIDRENANFDAAMALLHARFGGRLGAVTIPIGQAEEFQGVIDIIRMEARYFEDGRERDMIISGQDVYTEQPKEVTIQSEDVRAALQAPIEEMVLHIKDTFKKTNPDLASDIIQNGILLTGGGGLLSGLDRYLTDKLEIPVWVSETALTNVVMGCLKVLETPQALKQTLMRSK